MTRITKQAKKKIRHRRIRKRIIGTSERPRLSVFRSNRFIYAQLIDDRKNITLASLSEKNLAKDKKNKSQQVPKEFSGKIKNAYLVGLNLAQAAQKIGVKKVIFDRGGYKYHGRIKALADGARSAGLEF